MKSSEVRNFEDLQRLAQFLCDKDNHIDGILVLAPESEDKDLFTPIDTCTPVKFKGLNPKAIASKLLLLLGSSSELITSTDDFQPGLINSITFEFQELVLSIYRMEGFKSRLGEIYIVLINAQSKNLGSFNINKPDVRQQIDVGIRRCGQFV